MKRWAWYTIGTCSGTRYRAGGGRTVRLFTLSSPRADGDVIAFSGCFSLEVGLRLLNCNIVESKIHKFVLDVS
jgi:hypothetical protein